MAGFVGKIFSWFANEILIKTLAENRSFQRFALKVDSFLTTKQETLKEVSKEYVKAGETVFRESAEKVKTTATEKTGFDFMKFAKAFKDEVAKDMAELRSKTGTSSTSSSSASSTKK
jgi:hypothetical protein